MGYAVRVLAIDFTKLTAVPGSRDSEYSPRSVPSWKRRGTTMTMISKAMRTMRHWARLRARGYPRVSEASRNEGMNLTNDAQCVSPILSVHPIMSVNAQQCTP
jgi:hypothetical protein